MNKLTAISTIKSFYCSNVAMPSLKLNFIAMFNALRLKLCKIITEQPVGIFSQSLYTKYKNYFPN